MIPRTCYRALLFIFLFTIFVFNIGCSLSALFLLAYFFISISSICTPIITKTKST